jgi:hypothetical protein
MRLTGNWGGTPETNTACHPGGVGCKTKPFCTTRCRESSNRQVSVDRSAGSTDCRPHASAIGLRSLRPIVGALAPEVNAHRLTRLRRTDIRPVKARAVHLAQPAESRCHPATRPPKGSCPPKRWHNGSWCLQIAAAVGARLPGLFTCALAGIEGGTPEPNCACHPGDVPGQAIKSRERRYLATGCLHPSGKN